MMRLHRTNKKEPRTTIGCPVALFAAFPGIENVHSRLRQASAKREIQEYDISIVIAVDQPNDCVCFCSSLDLLVLRVQCY